MTLHEQLEALGERAARAAMALALREAPSLARELRRLKAQARRAEARAQRAEGRASASAEAVVASRRAEEDYLQQLVVLKRECNKLRHAYRIAVNRIEELENAKLRPPALLERLS